MCNSRTRPTITGTIWMHISNRGKIYLVAVRDCEKKLKATINSIKKDDFRDCEEMMDEGARWIWWLAKWGMTLPVGLDAASSSNGIRQMEPSKEHQHKEKSNPTTYIPLILELVHLVSNKMRELVFLSSWLRSLEMPQRGVHASLRMLRSVRRIKLPLHVLFYDYRELMHLNKIRKG